MSSLPRGIVLAHGTLASALVHEAERIGGVPGVLTAVSNDGCGREALAERLGTALGTGPAVIFVDMPCGSCYFAAMHALRTRSELRVVSGVNLPMLLDFVHHRELNPQEGAQRAAGKGADAIRQA